MSGPPFPPFPGVLYRPLVGGSVIGGVSRPPAGGRPSRPAGVTSPVRRAAAVPIIVHPVPSFRLFHGSFVGPSCTRPPCGRRLSVLYSVSGGVLVAARAWPAARRDAGIRPAGRSVRLQSILPCSQNTFPCEFIVGRLRICGPRAESTEIGVKHTLPTHEARRPTQQQENV